jgi:hypothetical protein
VFDSYGALRLARWREFRDNLENSPNPFQDVAELWARAPLVNPYLDPNSSDQWPDPWHLVLDDRYDDLAICLGMLYTLKLTQRFMDADFEIHTSMSQTDREANYFLIIDNSFVLNWEYRRVVPITHLNGFSRIVWSKENEPINNSLHN